MKGKSTWFMLEFMKDFVDGRMDRYFFDLDFDGYIIEHFPQMEKEYPRFATYFADAIIPRVDLARDRNLPDGDFRQIVSQCFLDAMAALPLL